MASALPASSRAARAFWTADCSATTAGDGLREVSAARRALATATADVTSASSRSAVAADCGLLAGGELGGVLRALPAVERLAERQPIVALTHRRFGAGQRIDGGRELLGGVAVGAGGARGVDGPLGLMEFLVGRIGAADGSGGHTGKQTRDDKARHRA